MTCRRFRIHHNIHHAVLLWDILGILNCFLVTFLWYETVLFILWKVEALLEQANRFHLKEENSFQGATRVAGFIIIIIIPPRDFHTIIEGE